MQMICTRSADWNLMTTTLIFVEPPITSIQIPCVSVLRHLTGQPGAAFRAHQLDIILSILHSQNSVIVAPTGSGKSVFFMVPSLVTGHRFSVIILPTLSLIADMKRRFDKAGYGIFVDTLVADDTRVCEVTKPIFSSPLRTIYLATPEGLLRVFEKFAMAVRVNSVLGIFIDECHLALTQGLQFRASYMELLRKLSTLTVPKTFLTATLLPSDEDRLVKAAGLSLQSTVFYRSDLWRENVTASISMIGGWQNALDQCVNLIRRTLALRKRTLIFCPS